MKYKGLTPVVATVLLIGITVTATGTYYATQEAVTEEVGDRDIDVLETFDYRIEQCYMKNAETKLVVRNTEKTESVDPSSLSVFLQGAPQNPSYSKDVVGPQRTFEISIDANAHRKKVKIASGEESETELCNLEGFNADFNYNPTNPGTGDNINLDASSATGAITVYEWDIDDDGSYEKSGTTTTHSYSSSGDKDVTLKVTNNNGNTDTITKTITVAAAVSPTLNADFNYNPVGPASPTTVDDIVFNASSATGAIANYEWNITSGGGYEKTGKTIKNSYSSSGDKDVTLKVANNNGNTDTITKTITVYATFN